MYYDLSSGLEPPRANLSPATNIGLIAGQQR